MVRQNNAVLVVDDDALARRSVGRVLERAGFEVLQVGTAAGARSAVQAGGVTVVVLDIDLPDSNGVDLLREFHSWCPEICVVMLTGSTAQSDMEESIRCGAVSYLRKPLDPLMLQAQVAAAQRSYENGRIAKQRCSTLEGSLLQAQFSLEQIPRQLAQQLCGVWGLRHVETGTHIRRIAAYSEALALALGFEHSDAATLGQVAMLHDVGKVAIPDAILTKPGKLTAEEFAIMKLHSEVGARMLTGIQHPFIERAAVVALRHHERWDGSGYPGNLRGEQCPYDARIVAVADVYDALGQARCYKPSWSATEIEAYFRQHSGQLFEPKIVDALLDAAPRLRSIALGLPELGERAELQHLSGAAV